jgi:hypothetical protein
MKGCFIVHLFGNALIGLECNCCRILRYVAAPFNHLFMCRMVLFAKLEEEAPFQPINMSPTLTSLVTALKQRFPQLQTLKVDFSMDYLLVHRRLCWYRGETVLQWCWAELFGSKCNLSMQISPLDGWLVSALSNVHPHWGEGNNFSADFNPNHNHVSSAPKQARLKTTSRSHHHATLKQIFCM